MIPQDWLVWWLSHPVLDIGTTAAGLCLLIWIAFRDLSRHELPRIQDHESTIVTYPRIRPFDWAELPEMRD